MRARFLVLGLAVAGLGCNSILGNNPHEAAGGTFGAAGSGGGASGTAGKGGGGGVAGGGAAGGAGQGGSTVGGSGGAGGGAGGSTGGSTAGRGGSTGAGGTVGGGGTGGTAGRGGTTGTGGTGGGAAGRGGTTGTGGTVGTGGSGGAAVPRTLSLLAGQLGGPGNIDGIGAAARFNGPYGIAIDASGNAFVADTSNHTIRRVVLATGAVSTIAGAPGVAGSADGAGAVARFNGPWGLAIDTSGGFSTLYIADSGNNVIRRLDVSQNRVTTIAGTAGPPGSTDATGAAARFNSPRALALDSTSGLYVADSGNNTIRIIGIGTYAVTTLAGTAGASGLVDATGAAARFRLPNDLALDGFGNLFVSDGNNSAVRKVVPATGVVTTLASGGLIAGPASIAYNGDIIATTLSTPSSLLRINTTTGATSTIMSLANEGVIRFDPNNTSLYLGTPHEVDKIDVTAKTVSRVAGSVSHLDLAGTGLLAYPSIIGSNGADLLFVNSGISYRLQQIVVSTGAATTYLAPTCLGSFTGIANVRGGTLTAACASSNTIVNMSQSGTGLTTVAGSDFVAGGSDGTGSGALFNSPQGLGDDGAGNVYVADAGNHTIRKVVVATGVVTTLAGMAGVPGSAPGTGTAASFNGPTAVASDGAGNLYVADAGNHTIRQIVISSRIVSTIAGTAGMAGTTDGAGAAARFLGPTSVVADGAGNLYVSDGNTVRQIALAGANVTTLVGVPGHAGVVLGALPAGLNRPGGMAVLPSGAVAITDSNENAVLILK